MLFKKIPYRILRTNDKKVELKQFHDNSAAIAQSQQVSNSKVFRNIATTFHNQYQLLFLSVI